MGIGTGAVLFLAKEVTGLWAAAGLPAVNFLYMTLALFGLSLLSLWALSRGGADTAAPGTTVARGDVAGALPRGLAALGDHRVQAAALIALTAAGIIVAW